MFAEEQINKGGNKRSESGEANPFSFSRRKDEKYDAQFYGELQSVGQFKDAGTDLTLNILKATGGKFMGMRKDNHVLWKPTSRIYTKEFMKRFPKLDMVQ